MSATVGAVKRPPTELEKLINAVITGDKTAVPKLEAAFQSANEPDRKCLIASTLVRAGVKDEIYFDYLALEAQRALASDAPNPVVYGPDGKLVKGKWNPEFLAWCKKRGVEPYDTAMSLIYELPAGMLSLASSGDPRGYDLLVRGVHSNNYVVAIFAARGLALIQDRRAIHEIIAACQAAPAGPAFGIAWALVYFHDAEAQHAAEKFITDKRLLAGLREDEAKRGTKALFGW
jgi:hypothetical protein